MANLFKHTKRVWTAFLAGALILTTVPYDIFAETDDEGYAEESIIVENLISSDDSLSSEPSSEEYEEPAEDELLADMPRVTVKWPDNFEPDDVNGATPSETGVWYVDQIGETGNKKNVSVISFKLPPVDHYEMKGYPSVTIGGVYSFITDDNTTDPTYTVKMNRTGTEPIDGNVVISATAVPITHTATVTNDDDKTTFSPVSGMTATTEEGTYTVSEAESYSFTVTLVDPSKHFIPAVKINNVEKQYTSLSDTGVYTYKVDNPNSDQTISIGVTGEPQYTLALADSDHAKLRVTTKATPVDGDFEDLSDSNNKYYRGDVVYYKVEPEQDYKLYDVKIGGESQSKVLKKDYYMYTFGATDVTVTAEVSQALELTVSPHAKLKVTTKEKPTASDFAELSDTNNKYYPGDVVYYKVEAADNYRFDDGANDAVKIEGVNQSKESNKDYYKYTFGTDPVTVTAKVYEQIVVNFNLTGVGTLNYKVGDGNPTALKITNGKGSILVDKSTDEDVRKLEITKVTAATGYNVQTDYAGVTVNKVTTAIIEPIEYNKDNGTWDLGGIKAATEVTVDVKKVQCVITLNNTDKRLKKVKATELYKDSNNNWIELEGKHNEPVTFTNGKATLSINKNNKVRFSDFVYADDDTYSLLKTVKAVGKVVSESNGEYTTDIFSGATGTAEFTTARLATDDVKFAANNDLEKLTVTFDSGTQSAGSFNYLERDGGVVFTASPKADKLVRSVTYVIGSGTARYTALKMTEDNKFSIPEEQVRAGILAGSITLTADTGAINVTTTVTKEEATGTIVKYQEYKAVGNSYEIVGTEQEVESSITIRNGNVFALTVDPGTANLVVSDSVTFNGVVLAKETEDAFAGKYLITPIENKENKLTVNTYAKVGVSKAEAQGHNKSGESDYALTTTTISSGVSDNKTTGEDIIFTVGYADEFSDFQVTLAEPEAYYDNEGSKTYLTVDKNEDNIYTIRKSEVEKAIKAGKPITVEAKATAVQLMTATLNTTGSNISSVVIRAYKDSSQNELVRGNTLTNGAGFDFQKGNYIVIGNLEGIDADTDFIRFTKTIGSNSSTFYGTGACSFDSGKAIELGTVNDSFTLMAENRKFSTDKVTAKLDPEKPTSYEVEVTVPGALGGNVKIEDSITINLKFNPNPLETKMGYKLDTKGAYSVVSGTGKGTVDIGGVVRTNNYSCKLPSNVFAEAAFAEGIELKIGVKEAGYLDQVFKVEDGYQYTECKAVVNGESVEYSEHSWKIPYGENANITITPRSGYCIKRVDYIDVSNPDSNETVLPNARGEVVFKLLADRPYYIFVTTDQTTDYTLEFGPNSPAAHPVVLKNETGLERDIDYNDKSNKIVVKKGATPEKLNPAHWVVNAVIDGMTDPVTDKVFGNITAETDILSFDGSDPSVQGNTVTVTIKSVEPKKEGSTEPKYLWTLQLNVNKEIKPENIKFGDDKTFQLGQTDGIVDLKIPSPDFDTDRINIIADGAYKDKLHFHPDYKNKALLVTTTIEDKDIIGKDTTFMIVDKLDDPDNPTVISSCKVTITNNEVKEIPKNALDNVTAEATNDMIRVNFKDIPFGYPALDNLYYLVNVVGTDIPATAEVKQKVENILVPATAASYNVNLANNDESYETNSYTYNVTVQLVQTIPVVENGKLKYVEANNAAISGATGSTTATTEESGTFATKLTFTKNKDKNYARIFSTMEDVVLGTVSFPDVAPKVPVTVKRLKKVEITDKTGNVLFSTQREADAKVVRIENYDTIVFNPHEAGVRFTGDYKVVAYAVEPKGIDVSVTAPLKVEQGITGLTVSAPGSIYKAPGKAASIKVLVSYDPDEKPLPTKKVEWSLTSDAAGKEAFVFDGVTIKNGTISIKNNVTIPETGLDFYVCAKAADYATHDLKGTAHVGVHSKASAPAYITIGSTEIYKREKGDALKEYYTSEWNSGNCELKAYDAYRREIDATFTVSGLTVKKDQNNVITGAFAEKINTNVSVTATTKDGSNLKTKFEFRVVSDKDLGFDIIDGDGKMIQQTGVNVYENNFTHNMTLYVYGKTRGVINHSVSTDAGIKKVKTGVDEKGTWYKLAPAKNKGVVTITDNTTKTKTTITIINNKIVATNTAAPKITAENWYDTGYDAKKYTVTQKNNGGNIFNYMSYVDKDAYENAGSFNKVTYTVKNGKDPQTGKVLISTDNNELNWFFDHSGLTKVGRVDSPAWEYTATLDEKGQFTVDYIDENGNLNIPAGNYSFTLTPINSRGEATAKAATFKFKAAAAPKAKVTVGTAFDLFKSYKKFGDFKVQNIVFNEGDGANGSAEFTGAVKGINTKGTINKFATKFATTLEYRAYGNGWLTCIDDIDEEDYDGGNILKGMSGWVEYGWTNLDGTKGTTFVKVNPKPVDKNHPFIPYHAL